MYEWLVQSSWMLWLGVFLVLAVIEMLTLSLYFVLMSVGALAAIVAYFAHAPFALQVVVFAVVALAMTIFVRPIAFKHLRKGPRELRTNVAWLIGHGALVVETVTSTAGLVKIGGDTWTARTHTPDSFTAGTPVEVTAIEGATAIVALPNTAQSNDSATSAAGQ